MMDIPKGWKLVPVEPTMAMECAYRAALKDYIERLPPEQRKMARKSGRGKYGGMRVNDETVKIKIRWRAMLNAAPTYEEEA